MGKTCFFICKNNGTDHLVVMVQLISIFAFASYMQIVQSLYFFNLKANYLLWLYSQFVWDLVGNPEDGFSRNARLDITRPSG